MVQGLAFLSKKSWHVKNISNQEKVWVAEQREQQEKTKAKELAKQIQQEREQEELEKISGKPASSRLDRGIDWMYYGHEKESEIAQQDAAKKSEEYLLGKEFVPNNIKGDLAAAADESHGYNAVVGHGKTSAIENNSTIHAEASTEDVEEGNDSKVPAWSAPSVAELNEAFRMRHEDPMFAVSCEAMRKQQENEKKKELYERVTGKVFDVTSGIHHDDNSEGDHRRRRHRELKKEKKEKKAHKRHKKARKREHRERRRSLSEDEDSNGDWDSENSRYIKKTRHGRRRKRSRSPDSYASDHDTKRRYGVNRGDKHGLSRPGSKINIDSRTSDRANDYHQDEKCQNRFERKDWKRDSDCSPHNCGGENGEEHHRRGHQHPSRPLNRLVEDSYDIERNRRYDFHHKNYNREQNHYCEEGNNKSRSRFSDESLGVPNEKKKAGYSRDLQLNLPDRCNLKDPPETSIFGYKQGSEAPRHQTGYGLQNASSRSSTHPDDPTDLGPDRELLRQKRKAREDERKMHRNRAHKRHDMTAEERAEALRAMQENAQQRLLQASRRDVKENGEDEDQSRQGQGSFLMDVTRQAHGVSGNAIGLGDRLAQNRFKNQRRHEGFL